MYDARADSKSYTDNRLGPSLRAINYGPVGVCLVFVAFPLIFLAIGIAEFGLPPLSAKVLVPFLAPVAVFGGLTVYLARVARSKPSLLPDSYSLDSDGIFVHRSDGKHERIDWDDPRLFFRLIDQRQGSSIQFGNTQLWKSGAPYPLPAEMFDTVLQEARERHLAGPTHRPIGGRASVVNVASQPRFRR